ncbi:MAG: hypothetical protein ABIY55_22305, partial [Kofleriaceae bacterium]
MARTDTSDSPRDGRARPVLPLAAVAWGLALAACGGSSSPPPPTNCPGEAADVWVGDPQLCVFEFAAGLNAARQMAFAPNGDLFVNNGRVTVVFDADHSGTSSDSERATFATAPGLNHGLAFSRDASYVYASSPSTVFRWRYTTGARAATG